MKKALGLILALGLIIGGFSFASAAESGTVTVTFQIASVSIGIEGSAVPFGAIPAGDEQIKIDVTTITNSGTVPVDLDIRVSNDAGSITVTDEANLSANEYLLKANNGTSDVTVLTTSTSLASDVAAEDKVVLDWKLTVGAGTTETAAQSKTITITATQATP